MQTTSMLTAYSTGDVPLALVRQLAADLRQHIAVEVDEQQRFFKSLEPPSFVALLADAPLWLEAFGAYAALYGAELVREAAKETWKQRAKIVSSIQAASAKPFKAFVGFCSRLRVQLKPHATLRIGLPIPDDFFGAQLFLESTDESLLAAQIALFIFHLPALVALIQQERLADEAFGAISLRLQDDGSLEVKWQDKQTQTEARRVLRGHAA